MDNRKGHVLGTQLQKARETVRFPPEEVAQRLHIGPGEVGAWEAERARPSLQQLEALAELYGREIDYFLKDTPPTPAQMQFRSVTDRTFEQLSSDARLVIARFDELCRTALELEQLLDKVKPTTLTPSPSSVSPTDLAREQRITLGFDQRPVSKLREHLTRQGIRIFEMVVPLGQFSGFSYWHNEYGPCILINAKDLAGRRNFTLAHEYAHLLYHHQPSICDLSEEGRPGPPGEERSANLFAIEFLLPVEPIHEDFERRALSTRPSVQDIGKMAGKWSVSVQAMAYRLEELGLFERGYAQDLLSAYQPSKFARQPKVPTWQRRLGKEFVSSAIVAYREGHISLGKLASSLDLPLRKALEASEQYEKKR